MAHGLEARAPFLDHKVVEFAATLPTDRKIKGSTTKVLLRAIAKQLMPDSMVDRPKMGFGEEGIPRERVHIIHNAVTTVPTSDILRRKLRAGWGSSDLNVVVGSVGNFRPGKGHDMLLDLAERLRTVDTSIRYVLVGSGPLQPWLEQNDPETAQ